MKKLILTIAVSIAAAQVQAQISIAPEVGVNLANASVNQESPFGGTLSPSTKMKVGIKAGAFVDIPVAGGFFIQPGAFFSMKGYKSSYSLSFLGSTASAEYTASLNYVEIPVNLGYRYTIGNAGSIFVTAGPYLGYAISGKVKGESFLNGVSQGKEEEDIDFGSGDEEVKPLDFGLNFSAGYQLPMGLYVRAQYGLGLSNLANNSGGSFKNRVLAFSLGYAFPIGGN